VHRALRRPAVLATALALLVPACGAPTASGPASGPTTTPTSGPPAVERPATVLRVALGRDPLSIDPRHLADDEGEMVVRALFDGLVDLAPDGTISPAAAERWDLEDDGLTYRFHLPPARFHDGEEVTAGHHADALLAVFDPARAPLLRDDLLRSLRGAQQMGVDPQREGSSSRGSPEDILAAGGLEVIGPRELVLRLERPDPLLLHQLTDPALVPLPRLARSDPERFALEPVGNGPFRMVGPREPGAFIRLAADQQHRRPPRIDGLVLQIYASDPDRELRWEDLLAGRLHVSAIPAASRAEARERFGRPAAARLGSGLHDTVTAALYAYAFAIDVPPFDDARLRQSVAAAIDRASLASALSGAGVEPADAILPAVLGGVRGDCAHCVHDPVLARARFAEWAAERPGLELPLQVTLTYPQGGGHATIAERIAADLERVLDVSVRLQSRDLGGLVREVRSGAAPLFRLGIRAAFGGDASAVAMLDPTFRPGAEENWTRWSDVGTQQQLDELAARPDPLLARDIEAQLLTQAAVVPLLWTRHDLVVHPDVAGFRLDPTGRWWPELVRLR